MRTFKRVAAGVAAFAVVIGGIWMLFRPTEEKVTLNVYNWGQYISEGQDDTIDVIAEFEK